MESVFLLLFSSQCQRYTQIVSGLSFVSRFLPALCEVWLQRQLQVHPGQSRLRGHSPYQEELPVLQVLSTSTFEEWTLLNTCPRYQSCLAAGMWMRRVDQRETLHEQVNLYLNFKSIIIVIIFFNSDSVGPAAATTTTDSTAAAILQPQWRKYYATISSQRILASIFNNAPWHWYCTISPTTPFHFLPPFLSLHLCWLVSVNY